MKKTLFSLALLLLTQNLLADFAPQPYRWSFQGEYLYWKPYTENQYFFTTTFTPTTPSVSDFLIVPTNFHSAFRIVGEYNYSLSDSLEGRFCYFNGSDQITLFGQSGSDNITGVTITDGEVSSKLKFRYYAADLALHNTTHHFCNLNFSFLEGLNFVWLDYEQFNSLSDSVGDVGVGSFLSRDWGIGPEFGINLDFLFPWNISLTGNARAALLISNLKSTVNFISGGSEVRFQENWLINSMFDARLGVDWHICYRCMQVNVEVGYEFVWYRNAIQIAPLTISQTQRLDMGFQGPYAALGVSF